MGPLLFILYINDLLLFVKGYGYSVDTFADETSMYRSSHNVCDMERDLNSAMESMKDEWDKNLSVILGGPHKSKPWVQSSSISVLFLHTLIIAIQYGEAVHLKMEKRVVK